MFSYHKRLLYPIQVEYPDRPLAAELLDHIYGTEGELRVFHQIMIQRLQISIPSIRDIMGLICAEELGHIELLAEVIKRHGMPAKPSHRPSASPRSSKDTKNEMSLQELLLNNSEMEEKMKGKYAETITRTKDPYMKKLLEFLKSREALHQKMFLETAELFARKAGHREYAELVHTYKMSLRIIT